MALDGPRGKSIFRAPILARAPAPAHGVPAHGLGSWAHGLGGWALGPLFAPGPMGPYLGVPGPMGPGPMGPLFGGVLGMQVA